jgi:hypothetical protein
MTPAPGRYAMTRWQRRDFGRPVASIVGLSLGLLGSEAAASTFRSFVSRRLRPFRPQRSEWGG